MQDPNKQTVKSFEDKWLHEYSREVYENISKEKLEILRVKFFAIFGVDSMAELNKIFSDGKVCLNAGCGVAWAEYLFNINENVTRYAVDYSNSVEVAKELTKDMQNVIISREDIFKLPFDDLFFDIIFSDGVLHHTGNAEGAFKVLCRHLKPGGLIGIYIYRTKPFLRRIIDKNLREITTDMSFEECLEFSKRMAKLGRAIQEIDEILVIEEDILVLEIPKGEYNLQRFIYDFIIKCFYNNDMGLRYSSIVNVDWYHPKNASFHTLEEVLGWFRDNGVKNIRVVQPDGYEYSGYYISGRKR